MINVWFFNIKNTIKNYHNNFYIFTNLLYKNFSFNYIYIYIYIYLFIYQSVNLPNGIPDAYAPFWWGVRSFSTAEKYSVWSRPKLSFTPKAKTKASLTPKSQKTPQIKGDIIIKPINHSISILLTPPNPNWALRIGPTGYTGGTATLQNELTARDSSSMNVFTTIPLTCMNLLTW